MERRDALKLIALGALPFLLLPKAKGLNKLYTQTELKASDFGTFDWGLATAAQQIEGAWNVDGRSASIWDTYAHKGKIKGASNADISCDFYHNYNSDIELARQMGFKSFRFSISWSRILPNGTGEINYKALDFYKNVIDSCLEKGITPWITLYHWDLPQVLEDKGGWLNRDIVGWFNDYAEICAKCFGDKVENWIVLNEPMGFTSLGYGIGYHAPGKYGINSFLKAAHHATLCQAEGGRALRNNIPKVKVGTSFSCSPIDAHHDNERDRKAARRLDALMNRLFVEPAVGLGYPIKDAPFLSRIEKFMKPGDDEVMKFDFDFFGLQNYFRIVTDFSPFVPYLWANQLPPEKRTKRITEMNWEVYPDGMYRILKQFSQYPVKEIFVTENGAAFKDVFENGTINDTERIQFFKDYLSSLLKAKNEGVNVAGYFGWTLLDNFEWTEGYRPKFGLVHVDFETQKRIIKNSGLWFKEFLRK
jgi:beta-glucosidase